MDTLVLQRFSIYLDLVIHSYTNDHFLTVCCRYFINHVIDAWAVYHRLRYIMSSWSVIWGWTMRASSDNKNKNKKQSKTTTTKTHTQKNYHFLISIDSNILLYTGQCNIWICWLRGRVKSKVVRTWYPTPLLYQIWQFNLLDLCINSIKCM